MNYQNKKKVFISVGLIMVPLVLIVIFIIYPTVKEIVSMNLEIVQERRELEAKLARGQNVKKTNDTLQEVAQSIEKLDGIFIQQNHELEFVTQLENIAAENNISLNINSDFNGSKITEKIKQITLQINITGDYDKIIKFLQATESLPNYYNVNLIAASTKSTGGGQLSMQLIGQTYLQETEAVKK